MANSWSETALRVLTDSTSCPRCGAPLTRVGECDHCRADLNSPIAHELWRASESLVESIHRWQVLAERVPTLDRSRLPVAPPAVAQGTPPVATLVSQSAPPTGSHVSQQSVLAIAGAGLLAVAAVVFTFLNPDLTGFATRTAIIGVVTALFLGGSWLLARQGLRFSSETIGALGLVFVVLDVWAFSNTDRSNSAVLAAVGVLVGSVALVLLAHRTGVLVWLWGALLGLLAVPAMFGYAADNPWATVVGHVGMAVVALGSLEVLRRLPPRLVAAEGPLRGTATVAQFIAFVLATGQILVLVALGNGDAVVAGVAMLLVLAALAALNTRSAYPSVWSFVSGALAAASFAALPLALERLPFVWLVALVPAFGATAVVLLAWASARWPLGSVSTAGLRMGAWSIALATAVPAAGMSLLQLAAPGERWLSDDAGLASILGLAATAVGTAALARLSPLPSARTRVFAVSLWLAAGTVFGVASWSALGPPAQLVIALTVAAALAVATNRVGWIAGAPLMLRTPIVTAAHTLLVVAAVVSWSSPLLSVLGGAAVVAVGFVLTWFVPVAPRAVYVAAVYAYGLIVVAAALGLADLPASAVLSLTSAIGSAVALAATLARRVNTAAWYALLAVTAVPFLVGVAAVLLERSGWSALSTGVAFALAATLVTSRRTGLTPLLRSAAAMLLVPSIAVVVVCLCAQFFESSGSPIALPVIAGLVAVVLPTADVLGRFLDRRGIAAAESRSARLAIESTALLTAALATLLAIVRIAAGLETTLVVLALVGIGGAAAAAFADRRYGWVIAGTAWTGALWCAYGLLGIELLEAYLLPPAIAAAVVGAVGVVRGNNGKALYVGGLIAATLPSLLALAVEGGSLRVVGLLTAACVLVVLGTAVSRLPEATPLRPLTALTGPTFLAAIVAAASGVLQAARFGAGLDQAPITDSLAMLPILGLGLVATAIAAVAARRFGEATQCRSRWLYVPAAVYFALAPMTGIAHTWLAILTLWGVMVVLLAAMLLTTRLARTRAVTLPPVWLLFALAWCVAVVGWSERELRVEAFSLPLGFALLAAGVIAMRDASGRPTGAGPVMRAGLASWPIGFSGSWHLLAPGLVVTLAPSVLSTATDPLTARAVLVIGLALVAILVGSKLRLAAPFLLGIVVLPIENVVVFFVQIGRSIGAAPWWITLATAGAVLLVLAVTSERRVSTEHGVAARLRDLR